jgi:hypothetical protein
MLERGWWMGDGGWAVVRWMGWAGRTDFGGAVHL